MAGGESTADVEVQGASAASFSVPIAGYFGRMENFDPKVEEWSTYVERLEMFFVGNNVPNEKKAASFLTLIGGKMYALLKSLTTPTKPTELSFTEIVVMLCSYGPTFYAETNCHRGKVQISQVQSSGRSVNS